MRKDLKSSKLEALSFRPVFNKLSPINFKKTNIKETIISDINLKSFKKNQDQQMKLQRSKKDFYSCIEETNQLEQNFQNLLQENFQNNEKVFQRQEKVRKNQKFQKKKLEIEHQRALLKQEFLEKLVE
jgi:cysteinyl-tRNA synthetase